MVEALGHQGQRSVVLCLPRSKSAKPGEENYLSRSSQDLWVLFPSK